MKRGFTLIELLVVITIIAVLVAFGLTNFVGARERARDVKKKGELMQLKNALRLYYNDYNRYPPGSGSLSGCGATGTSPCPGGCSAGEFAAGGADGCANIYMRTLPKIGTTQTYNYYVCADTDDFRLKVRLDNKSDPDIAASQAKCPNTCGDNRSSDEFIVCAD